MASTRSRSVGREHARPTTGGVAAEHATKIYTVATVGIIVIVVFLTVTSIGHTVTLATQHFLLFYAGVVCLMALCTSVCFGLVATDRMILHPGQRVFIQAAHRAASFASIAFLIIHIITEILAQREHVIDAVIPFLSPFKTFYIGLGTIAGDIMIMLVITGIMRARFNANGKAWRWRAMHYASYVCFVFGIWHGLLGGRPAKPYYDWTYGVIITLALLGLGVRVLSNSLSPKENLSAPPIDQAASSASAPLRAAAMLAQYGGTKVGKTAIMGGAVTGSRSVTGSQQALAAPVTATVVAALPAAEADAEPAAQPFYEPGYEGPPRYLGAPRAEAPRPEEQTGPVARPATGPMPRPASGPRPRPESGGHQRPGSGAYQRPGSGAYQRPESGEFRRPGSGAYQRPESGEFRRPESGGHQRPRTGPRPRPESGAYQRPESGAYPRLESGAYPRPETGPTPRPATGGYPAQPLAPSWTGPMPRAATGAMPQVDDGWGPGPGTGAYDQMGPADGWDDEPWQPAPTGPLQSVGGPDRYEGPMYTEPPGQEWLEASHDDGGYYQAPQWDDLPEPDPRYPVPGPGMPGYPGARDYRYGGDRY